MADKKNLCAQIDIALHNRVTEEKDRLEMTTSQYIASLLTEYYKMKDENGGINMTGSRTMAFQIFEIQNTRYYIIALIKECNKHSTNFLWGNFCKALNHFCREVIH